MSSPSASVPVILGSSPLTTSMAAPNRNPVITALDRNCDSQPILKTASSRKSTPAVSVTAATSWGASSPASPEVSTALAATAASAELGPVAICLLVPNRAYSSAAAAAAYRPFWMGTWAIPA